MSLRWCVIISSKMTDLDPYVLTYACVYSCFFLNRPLPPFHRPASICEKASIYICMLLIQSSSVCDGCCHFRNGKRWIYCMDFEHEMNWIERRAWQGIEMLLHKLKVYTLWLLNNHHHHTSTIYSMVTQSSTWLNEFSIIHHWTLLL